MTQRHLPRARTCRIRLCSQPGRQLQERPVWKAFPNPFAGDGHQGGFSDFLYKMSCFFLLFPLVSWYPKGNKNPLGAGGADVRPPRKFARKEVLL